MLRNLLACLLATLLLVQLAACLPVSTEPSAVEKSPREQLDLTLLATVKEFRFALTHHFEELFENVLETADLENASEDSKGRTGRELIEELRKFVESVDKMTNEVGQQNQSLSDNLMTKLFNMERKCNETIAEYPEGVPIWLVQLANSFVDGNKYRVKAAVGAIESFEVPLQRYFDSLSAEELAKQSTFLAWFEGFKNEKNGVAKMSKFERGKKFFEILKYT